MATTLTLHQGDQEAAFVEHPLEVARRALLEAANLERDEWAAVMRRFASALPNRSPVRKGEGAGV